MDWLYTPWAYALILCVSLCGLATLDWRYRLLVWRNQASRKATAATLACVVTFFLVWDIAGIWLKIFSTNPRYVLGIYFFTPDLPLEEVMFLTLLTYVILIITRLVELYDALHSGPNMKKKLKSKGKTR